MWFTWLTPPAPAAIALLRCGVAPGQLPRWPEPGAALFARLRDAAGVVVDEAVVLRVSGTEAEIGVHGGPGARAAVSAGLRSHGWREQAGPPVDDARWAALAAAPSPAAVRWLLGNPGRPPPFAAHFLARTPLVLITGPANAGKSTLLNAWCGHQRALVSELPGTTRDLVAAETIVAGWRLRLLDSAGLRPTSDALERAGQDLVRAARAHADLVLHLIPAGSPRTAVEPGDLVVHGKADLGPGPAPRWSALGAEGAAPTELLAELGRAVLDSLGLPTADVPAPA